MDAPPKRRLPEHGTVRHYRSGCHCAECRAVWTEYQYTQRRPKINRYRGFPDEIEVHCWCDRFIVGVPRTELLAGLTRSCGHTDCRPKEAAHA